MEGRVWRRRWIFEEGRLGGREDGDGLLRVGARALGRGAILGRERIEHGQLRLSSLLAL